MAELTELEQIKRHLYGNSKSFIQVKDYPANKFIDKKVLKEEIEQKFGTVEKYILNLVSKGFKDLQFFLRTKNGSSSHLNGVLQFSAGIEEEVIEKQTHINYPQQQLNMPSVNVQHEVHNAEPILENSALYSNLHERHVDLRERFIEIKDDKKDLKSKLRKVKEKLEEANLKVKYAEKEKEYALQDAERARRGFFETETGKEVVVGLSGVISDFASSKLSNPNQGVLNGSQQQQQQFSEMKTTVLNYIKADAVNDAACEKILFTIMGLTEKGEDFIKEHLDLLSKYELKN